MNSKKIENILKLSATDRYSYFIRKVADFQEVWGLYDEGWALLADVNNNEVFPFWPEYEFAQICAIDKWSSFKPQKIALLNFLDEWLQGMIKDDIKAGIFYTPKGNGVIVNPKELQKDIEEELKQYE